MLAIQFLLGASAIVFGVRCLGTAINDLIKFCQHLPGVKSAGSSQLVKRRTARNSIELLLFVVDRIGAAMFGAVWLCLGAGMLIGL